MADTTEGSPKSSWPPTALSEWLLQAKKTANKLANVLEVTPRSIYALARGGSELVAPKTLIAVSNYTKISIDDLVRPYYNKTLLSDTGDIRFNHLMAKIGLHMHSNRCEGKLSPYISPVFRCGGSEYAARNIPPMTFKEMSKANADCNVDIHSVLISAHWYSSGTVKQNQSRTLHTYWRSVVTDGEANTTTDNTFVVFEFEKSIEEMGAIETRPQVTNWWWHRPTELHAEIAQKRVSGLLNETDMNHEAVANQLFNNRAVAKMLNTA